MKLYALYLLLLIFCLSSCSSSETEDTTPLYSCIQKTALQKGFDMDVELDNFEDMLIEYGVLSSNSGEAKLTFYKKVADDGDNPQIPMEVMQNERLLQLKAIIQFSRCTKHKTKENPEYAKVIAVGEKLKELAGGVHDVDPSYFAQALLTVMSAEDLEEPFYRAHFLVGINSVLERQIASTVEEDTTMTAVSNDPAAFREFATIITLDEDQNPVIDGKSCNWDELVDRAKPYISKQSNTNKEFIQIELAESENTEMYDRIINELQAAYREILSEFTMSEYGTPLDQTKRSIVHALVGVHPMRMLQMEVASAP
jgi:hypothetical protein